MMDSAILSATEPDTVLPVTPGTLTVIIPIRNERDTIREVIDRVLASPVEKEVIVVDDGSTDGTTQILQEMVKQSPQLRVIFREVNQGKGAAIRAAIPEVRGDYVIIQDGDLEYDPQEYPRMLRPMIEEGADIVYGSRFLQNRPAMRLPNRIINWLLARM